MSLVRSRDDARVIAAFTVALLVFAATIVGAYTMGVVTERQRHPMALESGCPSPKPRHVQCPDSTGKIPRGRR